MQERGGVGLWARCSEFDRVYCRRYALRIRANVQYIYCVCMVILYVWDSVYCRTIRTYGCGECPPTGPFEPHIVKFALRIYRAHHREGSVGDTVARDGGGCGGR